MKYNGRIGVSLVVLMCAVTLILNHGFRHEDVDWLSFVFAVFYAGLGWQIGKKYDKAKYDSERDTLTLLFNRRAFLEVFRKMKKLSDRSGEKLMILFLDVDNFKAINDQNNHETGDQVLRQISAHLVASFRKGDHIARWGGDEFVVVLPFMDETAMNSLQHRFKNQLRTLPIHAFLELSVSMGYAVYPDEGTQLNDLLKNAGKRMYGQKQKRMVHRSSGEDCVPPRLYNKL